MKTVPAGPGDAMFAILIVAGAVLCVTAAVHIICLMNKNSKEFVYADLGEAPNLLPVLGGFFLFPGINLAVGVAVWWYLLTHPPVWGKRTGGQEPSAACANPKCPGYQTNVTSYCRPTCKWNHDDDKLHQAYLLKLETQTKTARSKNGD